MKKENENDYVADIMNKWYKAMEENKVMVQPKASTLLGTILAGYSIESLSVTEKDVWAEALTKRGGEFMDWYKLLSEDEQAVYHARLSQAPDNSVVPSKQLLKG
tara:strand:+ start:263 stop:574 length:312 start_codon:yes stop_codon:yes gene_type:complete